MENEYFLLAIQRGSACFSTGNAVYLIYQDKYQYLHLAYLYLGNLHLDLSHLLNFQT